MVQLMPRSESICQIRIDFLDFELDGGSQIDKPYDRDSVTVMGTGGLSLGVGSLCGFNTGQHLYLPVQGTRWGRGSNRNKRSISKCRNKMAKTTRCIFRGGPANLRIHTQTRSAEFVWGF